LLDQNHFSPAAVRVLNTHEQQHPLTNPHLKHADTPQASIVPAKRALRAGEDLEASKRELHLATAFPRPVWLDHLLPLLELEETVTLRVTCKAIRAIVADVRADLGDQRLRHLKAMLTCFPKAQTVILWGDQYGEGASLTPAEQDNLIAWLKDRGHSMTSVTGETEVETFIQRAWRAGVFKTVKCADLYLHEEGDRDLIIDGVISGIEWIQVSSRMEAPQVERAALGYLRTFPALKEIVYNMCHGDIAPPPFIPPSLEVLSLHCQACNDAVLFLGSLPPMIESSGAKLRRLILYFEKLDNADTARCVGRLLQACSSTLQEVEVHVESTSESAAELAEGLASCTHLDRLTAPIGTFAVMPPGRNVTFSLVQLKLSGVLGDDRILSSLALWGLMAQGGFPNLSSLDMGSRDWRWEAELGPAMVTAFEGVAGTLKELSLRHGAVGTPEDGAEAYGVLQPLGEAIGKLRRLETLYLDSGGPGLAFHRIAQGIPEGSCPALRSLTLSIDHGGAWLACEPGIILPSVQQLGFWLDGDYDRAEPLTLALALKNLRYRGSVLMRHVDSEGGQRDQIRAILKPFVSGLRF
jgi:hypothetical protein